MVTFQKLQENYPYPKKVSRDALFDELGWSDLKGNPAYENTCAIRMSYCLIRSGILTRGRLKILKGPHMGKWIEPGQKQLTTDMSGYFKGRPLKDVKSPGDLLTKTRYHHGIISFMDLVTYTDTSGNPGGHIDLVWAKRKSYSLFGWEIWSSIDDRCGTACHWYDAKDVLFWEIG